jgi:hypothetical protein
MNPLKFWKKNGDSHYNIEPLQQKLFVRIFVGKGVEGFCHLDKRILTALFLR